MFVSQPSKRVRPFTLIELMVVIVIITVLFSMLLPMLGRSREKARQISCIANLKQVGVMNTQYSNDYKGHVAANYGEGDDYNKQLLPYTLKTVTVRNKSVDASETIEYFRCPSQEAVKQGFAQNGWVGVNANFTDNRYVRISQLPTSNETIFLAPLLKHELRDLEDFGQGTADDSKPTPHLAESDHSITSYGFTIKKKVEGSGNLLFFDGHAKGFDWDDPQVLPIVYFKQIINPSKPYSVNGVDPPPTEGGL